MKLWISGEVDADIGDGFCQTMNEIEVIVNQLIEAKYYGEGLKSWDVIMIITKKVAVRSHLNLIKEQKEQIFGQ
jgi:hypothetical protein